jgi:hypothetical protein
MIQRCSPRKDSQDHDHRRAHTGPSIPPPASSANHSQTPRSVQFGNLLHKIGVGPTVSASCRGRWRPQNNLKSLSNIPISPFSSAFRCLQYIRLVHRYTEAKSFRGAKMGLYLYNTTTCSASPMYSRTVPSMFFSSTEFVR